MSDITNIYAPELSYQGQIDQAAAVVSSYMDPSTGGPKFHVEMRELVETRINNLGLRNCGPERDRQLWKIQEHFMRRATSPDTRITDQPRVVLDLDGSYTVHGPGRERSYYSWLAPLPSLVFCEVLPQDGSIQQVCRPEGEPVAAMALWFDPLLAVLPGNSMQDLRPVYESGNRNVLRRWPDGSIIEGVDLSGEPMLKPNVYNPTGYSGICKVFGSIAQAQQAKQELWEAVRTLSTPAVDEYTEDPVRKVNPAPQAPEGI